MGYTGEAMLQKPLAVSQKGSGKGLEHLKQGDGLTPREGQCTAQYSGHGGARAHRPKSLKSDVKGLESLRAWNPSTSLEPKIGYLGNAGPAKGSSSVSVATYRTQKGFPNLHTDICYTHKVSVVCTCLSNPMWGVCV